MISRAYILAGGQSRRFGSDKARALRNGTPNLQLLAQNVTAAGLTVTAVAKQIGQYEDLGIPTIADLLEDRGPLMGIFTALVHAKSHSNEGWVLILTCDTLQFSAEWVALLANGISPTDSVVLFQNAIRQPFPGLYHTRLTERLATEVERPQRSVLHWLDGMSDAINSVACPPHLQPKQFNTLNELVALTDPD